MDLDSEKIVVSSPPAPPPQYPSTPSPAPTFSTSTAFAPSEVSTAVPVQTPPQYPQEPYKPQTTAQYPHDPYTAHMNVHTDPEQLQRQQPDTQAPMSANHQHQRPSEQPLHPSAYGQKGGEWQSGICECTPCSSCLLAWCLPCILVGQTSERIRDPSMQNADLLNSDCLIYGAISCFTGCGWIYGLLKRGEIRERYNIKGSGCNDCCVSFWCPCCALIQQDNEVRLRQQNAQPETQAYQTQAPMEMPQPVYQPQQP